MKPLRLLTAAAAIACLLCVLCACGHQTRADGVIAQGPRLTTVFRHTDGVAGQADGANLRVYLGAQLNATTWAHELAHIADYHAVSYAEVLDWAGTLPAHLAHQQDVARRVAMDARTIGGPDAHWIALGRRHGAHAVGHRKILDRIRSRL